MPYRITPFVPGETYHIFNRSIARQPIFKQKRDYQRIIDLVNYYRFTKPPLRFSHYNRLPEDKREQYSSTHLVNNKLMLDIHAYCIMPNHFHFLISPKTTLAVSDFMRNIQNAYSKYFNMKYKRTGSLFQFMFKAVRVESDEQMMHTSRYIHLNPVTSFQIQISDLDNYPYSSFKNYVLDNNLSPMIKSDLILSYFKSKKSYRSFVYDQVDYQQTLSKIKHLEFD